MGHVEVEGSSIDEAIDKALQQLGVARDQVAIDILSSPTKGLLGIGGRKAKVRVALRAPISIEEEPLPAPRAAARRAEAAPSAIDPELLSRARGLLQDILNRMGFTVTVNATEDDGMIHLAIVGDSTGVLIGRHGQTLDAFEYFLHRALSKQEDGVGRIVVDCEDYRVRRRESLEAMANRLAEQAKIKRRSLTIESLSPRERRIVHLALQNQPGLTTRSSGDGYYRDLLIIPDGAHDRGRPPRTNPSGSNR
jgi:spoIIIJ-associated protein